MQWRAITSARAACSWRRADLHDVKLDELWLLQTARTAASSRPRLSWARCSLGNPVGSGLSLDTRRAVGLNRRAPRGALAHTALTSPWPPRAGAFRWHVACTLETIRAGSLSARPRGRSKMTCPGWTHTLAGVFIDTDRRLGLNYRRGSPIQTRHTHNSRAPAIIRELFIAAAVSATPAAWRC
jgi:hypothetical protein